MRRSFGSSISLPAAASGGDWHTIRTLLPYLWAYKGRVLVALEDSFPYNKGTKRGALVSAEYGKGRWVYVGLGLWRELPAGVDGAYQLLANLISLGRP